MARVRLRVFVVATLLLSPPVASQAFAQTPLAAPAVPTQDEVRRVREELDRLRREFDALRRAYDERLLQLEQRLAQIGGGPLTVAAPPGPPAAGAPTVTTAPAAPTVTTAMPPAPAAAGATPDPQAPATQVPAGSGKVFNPDISVNGNFVGAAGKNPFATLPALQLSEVEAAFQAIVDPYARADFFLAAGPDGFEVEEGFITFTALPANLLLKVGKLRAQFGKMNTIHTHALPTIDRPIVTGNLVGGEEGFSDAGISISHLVSNPYLFLELTGEVYAGHSEVFQSDQRSKLAYVGRVRAYRDLTESSNVDVGASFAFGPSRVGVPTIQAIGMDKRLFGIDATFRYRPLRRAIYQRLNVRTEFIWSRQEMPADVHEHAFGMYASGEYQFARRWYIGARADRSGRATEGSAIDTGGSVFMTFWPTEFSQVRGQFRRIRFAEGVSGNEFLFQFNFSIGAHGAHVF